MYVEVLTLPLQYDGAGYLHFFVRFVATLESTVQNLDNIVDEECRQLLSMAVKHAFAHVYQVDPHFHFDRLLEDLPEAHHISLVNRVQDDANAFVGNFKPHVVDDTGKLVNAGGEGEKMGA